MNFCNVLDKYVSIISQLPVPLGKPCFILLTIMIQSMVVKSLNVCSFTRCLMHPPLETPQLPLRTTPGTGFLWRRIFMMAFSRFEWRLENCHMFSAISKCTIPSGWWLSPTPLKNDGLRQLG
jgi:hypothetical protein